MSKRTSIKIVKAPEGEVFKMNVAAGFFVNENHEGAYECSLLSPLIRLVIDRIATLGEDENVQITFSRAPIR